MEELVPNSVGWYILEGYPWWPVYICDVTKLRPNLHLLGSGHKKILKKARDFPQDFIVVYYFGSHDFSLVGLKKGVLRPWDCAQKDQFLKGHPKHLTKKKGVIEELQDAVQEAEDYLSQPEDIRLPQHMVPSDLDPRLEPPPPELVTEEMEIEEEEEEEEEEEVVEEKKKKEKKDKKEKKKKEKKKKIKSKENGEEKKRKSEEPVESPSPVKVAKTTEDADVKTEPVVKDNEEKKPPSSELTTEALSMILEKEIRWILVNCPFEEMTTKTVRKLLEDRLKMDLRHHKAAIKEGVARVINSMEEEDAGDSASTATDEAAPTPADETESLDVKAEETEIVEPVAVEVAVKMEVDPVPEEAARVSEHDKMKHQLEAASKNLSLALDLEPKIVDALNSLKTVELMDKDVLMASTLQSRLVKLRSHRSPNVCELVIALVKKWDVESLIPAPKPIAKEEILALKTKLENAETSHDELLVCLNSLGEMFLTIEHLKKTGIARAVSKLRQHGNDKVSAKAQKLREKWIKQINADNDSGSDRIKTLKTLNRILEQHGDGDEKLQGKQVAALEQLQSMSLETQDIIDSKVGISVSKLRKSSNEKVGKLAKRLRKQWQAEAKAKSAA